MGIVLETRTSTNDLYIFFEDHCVLYASASALSDIYCSINTLYECLLFLYVCMYLYVVLKLAPRH